MPVGLLTAIYLVEYGKDRPLARAITFFVDVMTGIPSIVAGLFAAAFFFAVVGPGHQNRRRRRRRAFRADDPGGGPLQRGNAQDRPQRTPRGGLRPGRPQVADHPQGGHPDGDLRHRVRRHPGDRPRDRRDRTASWSPPGFATSINSNVFSGWMASLPTFIYTQILNPTSPSNPDPSSQRAWGAALVLIILVMLLNLGARLIARIFAPKTGR